MLTVIQNEYLQIYIINKCPAERKLVKILYKKSERERMRKKCVGGEMVGYTLRKTLRRKKNFE